MSDCWKCDETLYVQGNYCTQCGAPQKPSSAAQSFTRSTNDFYRGLDNILDLVEGCPGMLAEGLAEMEGYGDISAAEWERRFENPFQWLRGYFYRLWLSHYDISEEKLKELIEEHKDELETTETDAEELPIPSNERCACGKSLPSEAPTIITRWKEATEATAVCFECFGQVSTRIAIPE